MEKRNTFIAIALSLLIFLGWNYLSTQMGWTPPPPPPQTHVENASLPATTQTVGHDSFGETLPTTPSFTPSPGRKIIIETPRYTAVLHTGGGVLQEFSFVQYPQTLGADSAQVTPISAIAGSKSPLGLLINGAPSWSEGEWASDATDTVLRADQSYDVVLRGSVNGIELERVLSFHADSYVIDDKVRVVQAPSGQNVRVGFTLGSEGFSTASEKYNLNRVGYYTNAESLTEESSVETLQTGIEEKTAPLLWGGIMNNYFLMAVAPDKTNAVFKAKFQDQVYRVVLEESAMLLDQGAAAEFACSYFIGPKSKEELLKAPNKISAALDYGWFSIIARPLMAMLKFLYNYVGHNYGLAIIALTVIVKIVFWPLSQKSYKSMEQMKRLQPMIDKIKEKYGEDKQKMSEEVMQLYKTYKVNPMSGCFPMMLQIPVFFGLYQGLMHTIELRHAPFISYLPFTDITWLADLASKDPFYITPVIMGATMFLQQRLSPAPADPTQAKVMMFMPLIFLVMLLSFPSGLVLYWLTNNVLSILQQWLLTRVPNKTS